MNINNNQEVQQIEIINDKINEVVIKPKKKYIYVKN